jgi:hypothetical protein
MMNVSEKLGLILGSLLMVAPLRAAVGETPSWESGAVKQTQGSFWRQHWYERAGVVRARRCLKTNASRHV